MAAFVTVTLVNVGVCTFKSILALFSRPLVKAERRGRGRSRFNLIKTTLRRKGRRVTAEENTMNPANTLSSAENHGEITRCVGGIQGLCPQKHMQSRSVMGHPTELGSAIKKLSLMTKV